MRTWRKVGEREEGEGLAETSNRKAKGRSWADNGKQQRKLGRQWERTAGSKGITLGMKVREGIQVGSEEMEPKQSTEKQQFFCVPLGDEGGPREH